MSSSFQGLKDLSDLSEREDHAVSYDLMSGYYQVGLHPRSRTFVGLMWEGQYYVYSCLPFGLWTTPWVFFQGDERAGDALEEGRH